MISLYPIYVSASDFLEYLGLQMVKIVESEVGPIIVTFFSPVFILRHGYQMETTWPVWLQSLIKIRFVNIWIGFGLWAHIPLQVSNRPVIRYLPIDRKKRGAIVVLTAQISIAVVNIDRTITKVCAGGSSGGPFHRYCIGRHRCQMALREGWAHRLSSQVKSTHKK